MTDETSSTRRARPDRFGYNLRRFFDGAVDDEPLLPEQFFKQSDVLPAGEKAIRYRVLKDALREFRKFAFATSTRGVKRYDDVYTWIISNDYAWPYSFVNLCDVFSIDVEAARAALIHWKNKEQERREAEAAQAEVPRPECGAGLQAEGGSDVVAERAAGWIGETPAGY